MHVAQRMTADEFLAVGYDGIPTWLVEGEVVVSEPELLHQAVALELIAALGGWTRGTSGRGRMTLPLDVKLDERNVFGPDLMWYAEGDEPARHDKRPYPLPALVVEVRSPSTWRHDIGPKKAVYERGGLAELWLVDTVAEVIRVFRRSEPGAPAFDVVLELGAGEQVTSPQLPGFALPVTSLFAD